VGRGAGGGASLTQVEPPWQDDLDDPADAPRAQFVDDGTVYEPMPEDWPD
jgi:hypothetical protein